jgi:hypothetical protein
VCLDERLLLENTGGGPVVILQNVQDNRRFWDSSRFISKMCIINNHKRPIFKFGEKDRFFLHDLQHNGTAGDPAGGKNASSARRHRFHRGLSGIDRHRGFVGFSHS